MSATLLILLIAVSAVVGIGLLIGIILAICVRR